MGSSSAECYDYAFKIALIGDSSVGKTSLIQSFISHFADGQRPTLGMDTKDKFLTIDGKKLKLTIWDTAGQERYRTVIKDYYRGAHGIIMVYDVTRRDTFTNLTGHWAEDIELYSTNEDCIKILVGNKVDKASDRKVTREEASAFAKTNGYLFLECSAKTRENVEKCFHDLTLKILEVPNLLEQGSSAAPAKPASPKKQTYTAPPGGGGGGGGGGCCTII